MAFGRHPPPDDIHHSPRTSTMDPSALAGAESDAGADARVRAITKLTSLYDAGIPWFTKPALRELSRVLRTVRETGQSAELLLQSLEQGDVIPMQRLRIMPYDEDGDHDQRPFEFNGRELVYAASSRRSHPFLS